MLEPISHGKDNKQYRFILRFNEKVRTLADTPYGDPLSLD